MPRVVIVGAGICGLVAAGALRAAGWQPLILEQQERVGGRLRTERRGDAACDSGAQFFSVRAPAFATLVAAWRAAGLAEHWCNGFATAAVHDPRAAPVAVEDGFPRYRIAGGMERLAQHLARGLEVQCQRVATRLDTGARALALRVRSPAGETTLSADAAILTPPVPLALALIAAGCHKRALAPALQARLATVRYAPCLCLTLDFPKATSLAIPAPGAVRLSAGPLSWLASQRAKGLRASGDGVVVHAEAEWSAAHAHQTDEQLIAALTALAAPLLTGWSGGDWSSPAAATLTRWQHSLATATIDEPFLDAGLAAPVLLAGDAFGGRPRVEGAVLSGLAAAAALIGAPRSD